jgi:uncharacterized membrane protein
MSISQHPALHAANATIGLPVIAMLAGHFPVILGSLASIGAVILYTIQIYNEFEERRAKKAAETAEQVIARASVEAAALLDEARKTATQLAVNTAQAATTAAAITAATEAKK